MENPFKSRKANIGNVFNDENFGVDQVEMSFVDSNESHEASLKQPRPYTTAENVFDGFMGGATVMAALGGIAYNSERQDLTYLAGAVSVLCLFAALTGSNYFENK